MTPRSHAVGVGGRLHPSLIGARPASELAMTDTFSAPPELLEALEETLRLPTPGRTGSIENVSGGVHRGDAAAEGRENRFSRHRRLFGSLRLGGEFSTVSRARGGERPRDANMLLV